MWRSPPSAVRRAQLGHFPATTSTEANFAGRESFYYKTMESFGAGSPAASGFGLFVKFDGDQVWRIAFVGRFDVFDLCGPVF